jgi:hypothetical protein
VDHCHFWLWEDEYAYYITGVGLNLLVAAPGGFWDAQGNGQGGGNSRRDPGRHDNGNVHINDFEVIGRAIFLGILMCISWPMCALCILLILLR